MSSRTAKYERTDISPLLVTYHTGYIGKENCKNAFYKVRIAYVSIFLLTQQPLQFQEKKTLEKPTMQETNGQFVHVFQTVFHK